MTPHSILPLALTASGPSAGMLLPFLLLLISIAIGPTVAPAFWKRQYRLVSLGFGALSVAYYLFVLQTPGRMLHALGDYVSFIVVIGGLFVVSGGIYIRVQGEATPWRNTLFLLTGAVLANLLGATGASMILIRPWIRMNRYRITGFHIPFFIFLVSNVGGCLTPVGPPLFLGYLLGMPFFWITTRAWPAWLVAVGLLLSIFYLLDWRNFRRAPPEVRERETARETFGIQGGKNFAPLAVILAAVILLPSGLRELAIAGAALYSYSSTAKPVHEANHFSFAPIEEVAWLFLGIFASMVPAIDYLQGHAAELRIRAPLDFYWTSGVLSAVLDNAPTYVIFLAAAFGLHGESLEATGAMARFLAEHGNYAVAVSLGSVMFGALTYLGNGPNLMVKGIAEHARVHTPGFFTYIVRYSLPVLGPILAIVGWLVVHLK